MRLAESEQHKEELLKVKNVELLQQGMQFLRFQRAGEEMWDKLEEQAENVRRLQMKLDTALVRLVVVSRVVLWSIFCEESYFVIFWEQEYETECLNRTFSVLQQQVDSSS